MSEDDGRSERTANLWGNSTVSISDQTLVDVDVEDVHTNVGFANDTEAAVDPDELQDPVTIYGDKDGARRDLPDVDDPGIDSGRRRDLTASDDPHLDRREGTVDGPTDESSRRALERRRTRRRGLWAAGLLALVFGLATALLAALVTGTGPAPDYPTLTGAFWPAIAEQATAAALLLLVNPLTPLILAALGIASFYVLTRRARDLDEEIERRTR